MSMIINPYAFAKNASTFASEVKSIINSDSDVELFGLVDSDGGMTDYGANSLSMTVNGSPTATKDDSLYYLDFTDDSTDYFSVADNSNLSFGTDAFSIIYFGTSTQSLGYQTLAKSQVAAQQEYEIYLSAGSFSVYMWDSGQYINSTKGSLTLTDKSAWTMVHDGGTDGATIELYQDSTDLEATGGGGSYVAMDNLAGAFSSRVEGSSNGLEGHIYGILLVRQELTSTKIGDIADKFAEYVS